MSQFVMYIAWWGPYVVGVLAIGYAIIMRLSERGEETPEGRAPVSVMVITLAALAVGAVLTGILSKPVDLSWRFGVVLLIGGVVGLAAWLFSSWRAGSPLAGASAAFLGVGLGLLATAFLRNYFREAPMVYLFVAALGTWFVAAIAYYADPARFPTGVRTAALTASAITAAAAMGIYHYAKSASGSLFAVDICALIVLLGLVASLIAVAARRLGTWGAVIASVIFIAGAWWLGDMLAGVVINEASGGLCALAGAGTVLLLHIVACSGSGARVQLLGSTESGALAVLLVVACAAISMRWLGGYGAALASVGAVAALPFVYLIADLAPSRAASAPTAFASGAATAASLAAIGLVRVFAESTRGSSTSIRIFESYVIAGLVLGGVLVLMQASLARAWKSGGSGPLAAFARGIAAIILGFGLVLASAYFWRYEAMVGLVIGVVVGLFYSIFVQSSTDAPEPADISLGIPLFAVTILPAFLDATVNLTREQKINVLLWTLGAVAVVVIVTSVMRIIRGRGEPVPESAGTS